MDAEYPWAAFECVVCERRQKPTQWGEYQRPYPIAPVCRSCEPNPLAAPAAAASIKDRRLIAIGKLLADEVGWMAHRVEAGFA